MKPTYQELSAVYGSKLHSRELYDTNGNGRNITHAEAAEHLNTTFPGGEYVPVDHVHYYSPATVRYSLETINRAIEHGDANSRFTGFIRKEQHERRVAELKRLMNLDNSFKAVDGELTHFFSAVEKTESFYKEAWGAHVTTEGVWHVFRCESPLPYVKTYFMWVFAPEGMNVSITKKEVSSCGGDWRWLVSVK